MEHRCKFCPLWKTGYAALKRHVELDHPDEFGKVTAWLGRTVDPKLEQFERKAAEGLRGPGKTEVVPCQTTSKQ